MGPGLQSGLVITTESCLLSSSPTSRGRMARCTGVRFDSAAGESGQLPGELHDALHGLSKQAAATSGMWPEAVAPELALGCAERS